MDTREPRKDHLVTADMLQILPEPVQRYPAFAGVLGQPWVDSARVKQAGKFRRSPDQPWMPVTAEQTFTTDLPEFVWKASLKVAGLPMMSARDSYQDQAGCPVSFNA